jgi:cystathionine beta-lyase family protein involved in aluminum resistance
VPTKSDSHQIIANAEKELQSVWQEFDSIKYQNQIKILQAYKKAGIQNMHYAWVTGYGYDDLGKDKIDEVYSYYFNTDSALVRPQLVSGTHAITCAIFGNLNAQDTLVAWGKPYDTLESAFAKLTKKYQINYIETQEYSEIPSKSKLISVQRSRGYEWRNSYDQNSLRSTIQELHRQFPEAIIFVDNCYGEFTQALEPTDLGADLIAGSLIKNPGGGIVNAGGYVAGKANLVDAAADYLTAPGIGRNGGCLFDQARLILQGFYLAPLIVSEALKGMSLAAKVLSILGYETIPSFDAERNDIIQAIKLNSRERLIDFCAKVQSSSPVNSIFTPIPEKVSGYDDEIIMAAGAFIEGSSIELSCDGPLRDPYVAYLQGGLSYAHTKYFLEELINNSHL